MAEQKGEAEVFVVCARTLVELLGLVKFYMARSSSVVPRGEDWWSWMNQRHEALEMRVATFDSKLDAIRHLLEANNLKAVERTNKTVKTFETLGDAMRKEYLDMLKLQEKHRQALMDVVEALEKRVNEMRRYVDECMLVVKDLEDKFIGKLDEGLERVLERVKEDMKEMDVMIRVDALEKKWGKSKGAVESYVGNCLKCFEGQVDRRLSFIVKEIDERVGKIWDELDLRRDKMERKHNTEKRNLMDVVNDVS